MQLYDRNGVLLTEVYPDGCRTWISLISVSPHLMRRYNRHRGCLLLPKSGHRLSMHCRRALAKFGRPGLGGKRILLLQRLVRCPASLSASAFHCLLLRKTVEHSAPNEVTVLDGEFELAELHSAQVKCFVVRLASTCCCAVR